MPKIVTEIASILLIPNLRLKRKYDKQAAIGGIMPLIIGGRLELTWLRPIVNMSLSAQSRSASGKNSIKVVLKSTHLFSL